MSESPKEGIVSTITKDDTAEQLLQKIIKEGSKPGEIDKKELQALLESKAIEAKDIKAETTKALTKLKKEGLEKILDNGLTLSKSDTTIIDAIKEIYSLSQEVLDKLKINESFSVTLDGMQVILEAGYYPKSNDDRATISQEILDLADDKVQVVEAFKKKDLVGMVDENKDNIKNTVEKLTTYSKTLSNSEPDKKIKKEIESLISRYESKGKTEQARRDASKSKGEVAIKNNKEQEVDMFRSLYSLTQESEKILTKAPVKQEVNEVSKLIIIEGLPNATCTGGFKAKDGTFTLDIVCTSNTSIAFDANKNLTTKEVTINGKTYGVSYISGTNTLKFSEKIEAQEVVPTPPKEETIKPVESNEKIDTAFVDEFITYLMQSDMKDISTLQVRKASTKIADALKNAPKLSEVKSILEDFNNPENVSIEKFQLALGMKEGAKATEADGTIGYNTINALFAKAGVVGKDLPASQVPKHEKRKVDILTGSHANSDGVHKTGVVYPVSPGLNLEVEKNKTKAKDFLSKLNTLKHGTDMQFDGARQHSEGGYKLDVSYNTSTGGKTYSMIPTEEIVMTRDDMETGKIWKNITFKPLWPGSQNLHTPGVWTTYDIVLENETLRVVEPGSVALSKPIKH